MSFFSALYMLWNVLIVNISCNIVTNIQKKKTKKKYDPYFGMGKNAKSYATNTPLFIFLLGKGGNLYISNPIKSYKIASVLSDE